jgi:FixJ family two-component response regulator
VKRNKIVHIVDPDVSIGDSLSMLLGLYGIDVRTYADAESFLAAYGTEETSHGCLLVEFDLPGMSGLSLLRELRLRGSRLPAIILAVKSTPQVRAQAQASGALETLEKPLLTTFLLERLAHLLPDLVKFNTPGQSTVGMDDGIQVAYRVIKPEDEAIEQAFVRGLSHTSSRRRFFSPLKQLSPRMLEYFTHYNYPDSFAVIATIRVDDEERQIAVARYAPTKLDGVAEFAIVVADEWQGRGIATYLLSALTTAAAIAGLNRLEGLVMDENEPMIKLAHAMGFTVERSTDDTSIFLVTKVLGSPNLV